MDINIKIGSVMIFTIFALSGCSSGTISSEYDNFANCLTDSGAKMYGAYWCPYCNAQEDMFGDSFQYIDYIECSLPDGKSQTQICAEEGINGYPTWEFADGSRQSGKLSFEILSQASGCTL